MDDVTEALRVVARHLHYSSSACDIATLRQSRF